jgi:hypothetical protein
MRPLVFHLADNTMVEGLKAFFRRDNWHHALGCARFTLDPDSLQDFLKVPGENDQSVWRFADKHLAPFLETYQRALVVLDESFDPSPGAVQIHADICRSLAQAGWERERFEVIVIQPMLESWLWMDSDHVAQAFGCQSYASLRDHLVAEGLWAVGREKPTELKAARDRAAQLGRTKSGRTVFRHVFSAVSRRALDRCQEPGFQLLRRTLRTWFPPNGGAG